MWAFTADINLNTYQAREVFSQLPDISRRLQMNQSFRQQKCISIYRI